MSLSAPTLFGNTPAQPRHEASRIARSLTDLMHDGFYLLFMLRNRAIPGDADVFRERIRCFLDDFERHAKRQNALPDDIYDVKYAFCAAVDEAILSSRLSIRDEWERLPLQLMLFGEQLAGEQFFVKLEELRAQGAHRVQALEVFHHCLLHGFRGKYLLEGPEKINYLISRVGDEVVHHKGKRAGFAPHGAVPDRVRHALRSEIPVWVIVSLMAVMGIVAFIGMRAWLGHHTRGVLASYPELVTLAPKQARVTISLP